MKVIKIIMKVSITIDDVKHLSKLANFLLTEMQLEQSQKELEAVLTYMDEVKHINTASIEETTRVTDEINILREDEIGISFSQKNALKNAKQTHDGYFVVSRVLE